MTETTFEYTAECGCEIIQYGEVWYGDGFVPERTEIVKHCGDKWISVKDRLPENDQFVIAFNQEDYYLDIYGWFGDHYDVGFMSDVLRDYAFKVTHWIPLPDPPKESE